MRSIKIQYFYWIFIIISNNESEESEDCASLRTEIWIKNAGF